MHILFLSRWFPYPPNNGSKLRIYQLLRGLATRHEITLLCFADETGVDADVLELRSLCKRIVVVPWKPFEPQSWRARLGYFRLAPRSIVDTFSMEMKEQLERVLATDKVDMVIGSELNALGYAPYFNGLPALLEDPELGVGYGRYAQASTIQRRVRHGLTWHKMQQYLVRSLPAFRAVTVVSEQERGLLSMVGPEFQDVEVIPNCINTADYAHLAEKPEPGSLIFTGPFGYAANYDAMTWFLQEVYPLIQREERGVHLSITGDHRDLPLPPAENVTLTGFVEDVRPLIAGAWCSIAPLRSGGGTRLKILEAMALGTPVVATSKGAEGLDVKDGVHLLIGDTPQSLANAVLRLLREPGLRQRLAENGRQIVRAKYDWSAVMPRFLDLVERVARS